MMGGSHTLAHAMTDPKITCPRCSSEIRLTESLAAPLIESTRHEYERLLAEKDADFSRRDAALREREAALAKAQQAIEDQVAERLRSERSRIIADEGRKARLLLGDDLDQKTRELGDLKELLTQRDLKLAAAQQEQAAVIKKQRELDDARRELDLTVEKRVRESVATIHEQAKREAEDLLNLKVAEKEHIIATMQQQIEELRRRAEQGSQQLQGEVLELELQALLNSRFPNDEIAPVPKGEHGGDVLHRVRAQSGQACGTILWESKRTKNWSDGWLVKLRDDQRKANAEVAIIVSQALPKGVETFELVSDVWVTHPRSAMPVGMVLRHALLETASARRAAEGQQTKAELVYEYLTGSRFRLRMEAIVESFTTMREDLESERKVIIKQWSKREKQIERVLLATAGMYGDLQGMVGRSLPEVEGMSLKALEMDEPDA